MGSASWCIVLAMLLSASTPASSRRILPNKMTVRTGETMELDKSVDLDLCHAVVSEMHGETLKHTFKKNGEEQIYDTAEMAVCLGVVQNYSMTKSPSGAYVMSKLPDDWDKEQKEESMMADILGVFLLKQACTLFCDEVQMEVSEVVYKRVDTESPESIAADFCPNLLEMKSKVQKPFKPSTETKTTGSGDGVMDKFNDFLTKHDTSGTIKDIMDMEAMNPEKMLDEDMQADFASAREGLRCDVCKVAVRESYKEVLGLENSPRFKDKWQRESVVSEVVQRICHGPDYDQVAKGFYPKKGGNPPNWEAGWGVRYAPQSAKERLGQKKAAGWSLFRYPRGGEPWRDEDEAAAKAMVGMDVKSYVIFKTSAITQACRFAVDERLSEDDLAEIILDNLRTKPITVAKSFCEPVCKGRGGAEKKAASEL